MMDARPRYRMRGARRASNILVLYRTLEGMLFEVLWETSAINCWLSLPCWGGSGTLPSSSSRLPLLS